MTQITDPLQHATTIDYWLDASSKPYGLVKHVTDPNGKQTYSEFDARGNRTLVQDALSRQTHYQYDGLNRVTQITYPDNTTKTLHYETVRGRLDYVVDQNGNKTNYAYDDTNRLTAIADANAAACVSSNPSNWVTVCPVTAYSYDTESNLASIKDALGQTTSFHYDATTGWRDKTIFPPSGQTQPTEFYFYDPNGNLAEVFTRNSQPLNFSYDELNRVTSDYNGTYSYDLNSRLISATDPSGNQYGFTYDGMSRLIATTTQYKSIPSKTFSVGYSYDSNSNRQTMTDAEQGLTQYGYDTLNRLTSIVDFNSNNFGFGYDDISRRTSLTRQNGLNTNYAYQPNTNFLQSILHQTGLTTLDGATYSYDSVGNRLSRTGSRTNIPYSYSYDNIYQLTQSMSEGGCIPAGDICQTVPPTDATYGYDNVGNRTSYHYGFTVPSFVYSYSYNNPWNRLDSVNNTTSGTTTSYIYDANGNTKSRADSNGTTSYTWDFENRLTQVTLPNAGGTVTFQYDPFGKRIQKALTVNSVTTTTNYVYDGPNIIEEVDASGNQLARYSQGLGIDEPLSMTRGGVTSFYETDGLGSVTSLSNSSGTITDTYTYDSFGQMTFSGSTTNPFRYTGREWDSETGLYYYRARYYDPAVGRFINEDPIGVSGGINFYRYVHNNSTNARDPAGLQVVPEGKPPAEEKEQETREEENDPDSLGNLIRRANQREFENEEEARAANAATAAAFEPLEEEPAENKGCGCPDPPKVGQHVFRVTSLFQNVFRRHWSRVDPRTVSNYRDLAGLPEQNNGSVLAEGEITNVKGITVTPGGAAPLHGNQGGIDELLVPCPEVQIRLLRVYNVDKPF